MMEPGPSCVKSKPIATAAAGGWGKLNEAQSFNVIAQDMDRAFRNAGFSGNELSFLGEVREASWGEAVRLGKKRDGAWPEAAGCRINLTDLAQRTEKSRQQWSVAKRRLIASNVLIEDEDGLLEINKQADEWIFPKTGKPRLSPVLVEYCRAVQPGYSAVAQARFDFARERVNPRARHQTTVIRGQVDLEESRRKPCGDRVANHAAAASQTMRLGPAAYRNGREEEILETRREDAAPAAALVCDSGSNPEQVPDASTRNHESVGPPASLQQPPPAASIPDASIEPGAGPPPAIGVQASQDPVVEASQPEQSPSSPGTQAPSPTTSPSKAPPGPGADSPEAIELGEWASKFGGADVGRLARQWCDELPAEWIRLAIRRKVIGQPRRAGAATTNLLAKIFCDWSQAGVCEFIARPSKAARTSEPPAQVEYFRGTPGFNKKSWRPPDRPGRSAVAPVAGRVADA